MRMARTSSTTAGPERLSRSTISCALLCAALAPLALLGGCQQPARPAPPIEVKRPTQAPALTPARGLALLKESGERPADKLVQKMQERVERDPDKADRWIELGQAWVRKARERAEPGYYRNADACVELALALEPDNAAALDLRGLVLMSDHRFAAARSLAQGTLKLRPDDPMAFGTLSDAELELGNYPQALAAVERMLALKPNLPSYLRASYLAWLQGNEPAAREAVRHAIDAAPQSSQNPEPRAYALTQAALYFWHQGDYEGADVGLQMALQVFPGYPAALVGRARAALATGRNAEAVKLLAQAYEQSPLIETGWLLGDARTLSGDEAGAREVYARIERQGSRLDPRTLALYYATKGRELSTALRLLEAELQQRQDIYTQDAYAFALYRAGRAGEALPFCEKALRLKTRDAALLYHAGAVHLAAGARAQGQRLLREALKQNPVFDVYGAQDARRLLGEPPTSGAAVAQRPFLAPAGRGPLDAEGRAR